MPLYLYKDKKSELKVEVLRSFKEYDLPPIDEELPEGERGKERLWERLISGNQILNKWPSSTGPVKGRA